MAIYIIEHQSIKRVASWMIFSPPLPLIERVFLPGEISYSS